MKQASFSWAAWMVVGLAAGCCSQPPQGKPPVAALPAAEPTSYLTGPELAGRVLRNIVILSHVDGQEHGAGVVVGRTEDAYIVVTAKHVLQKPANSDSTDPVDDDNMPLAAQVSVTPCAGGKPAVIGVPQAISGRRLKDIAVVKVPLDAGLAFETRLLADEAPDLKGEEVWIVGREAGCTVLGTSGQVPGDIARIDDVTDRDAVIHAYVPRANPGSSGAALITARGLVGIVQKIPGNTNSVGAIRIDPVKSALQAWSPGAWALESSGNLPPTSSEAARRELNEALSRYLFDALSSRQILSRPRLNKGELAPSVNSYNVAINRFMDVRSKHDGAISRYWGASALQAYKQLRAKLWQVHENFLNLSRDGVVDQMYRSGVVPEAVQQRMRDLSEPLRQLETDINRFLAMLAAQPLPSTTL
jgi:hypothetical protein